MLRGRRLRRAGPARGADARCPGSRKQHDADLAIVNVENAAAGFGVTPQIARSMLEQGVDVMTSGNHIWDKKEIIEYIAQGEPAPAPGQLPARHAGGGLGGGEGRAAQGRGAEPHGPRLPAPDSTAPSARPTRRWRGSRQETPIIVVDVHCEATSESQAHGLVPRRAGERGGRHPPPRPDRGRARAAEGHRLHHRPRASPARRTRVIGVEPELAIGRFLTQMPAASSRPRARPCSRAW